MVNPSPLRTCDSHNKTPIIIGLVDSNAAPPPHPGNTIPYMDSLLGRTITSSQRRKIHLGFVRYGPIHGAGSHLSVIPISLVCAHSEAINVPASQTIAESSSDLAVLDSYVVAMKMFDSFIESQRAEGQNPEEEFSYHLWHIACSDGDCAEYEHIADLDWGLKWNGVTSELKRRNVKLSTILLSPCPIFSALFSSMSSEPVKPWFPTCPHHELLLSGFDAQSLNSDTAPPKALTKRPVDSLAENRSKRPRMEDSSQARTEPALAPAVPSTISWHAPTSYTSPIVPGAMALDLTNQPAAHEAQYTTDDKPPWLGNLIWFCGKEEVKARVEAINPIRNPKTSRWPMTLRVEIIEAGMSTLDMQARIRKLKAPVARIQCPPGIDNQHFYELVKTLREGKCVAVMQWEIEIQDQGTPKTGLVLAPLHDGLLCATFPVSDLPKASFQTSEQETQETQLQTDHAPLGDTSYDIAEYVQEEDLDGTQSSPYVAVEMPTQSMSPQQLSSQQPQVYGQGQLQQSQAQQDADHASLDTYHDHHVDQ